MKYFQRAIYHENMIRKRKRRMNILCRVINIELRYSCAFLLWLFCCFSIILGILPGGLLQSGNIRDNMLPFCFFSFPWIRLQKSQTIHFLFLHKSTFHSTLQILHLMLSTSFWHQLMFYHTIRILLSLLVAFVKMI